MGSDDPVPTSPERSCGACSLCCTVLRVDDLHKLGGVPCVHQRPEGGCDIYATRPGICRGYRCSWLQGGLRETDRPDRLGAVLDVLPRGPIARLEIREAEPGALARSPRLQEIANDYRKLMQVRITNVGDVMDPDRPYRVLLANDEEYRVAGEWTEIFRGGVKVGERRLPWLDRLVRRLTLATLARKLRRSRRRSA